MNEMQERHCTKCFSFRGVVVGALVGFGLIFLFNMITVGGGLAAYTKTAGGLETLVFVAYLWVIVGSFLVFFIAGLATMMVANHDRIYDHRHSITMGFTAWVLYLLISLAFLSRATESAITSFPQSFLSMSQEAAATSSASTATQETTAAVSGEKASNQPTSPEARKEAHKLGLATLAAFFIFFVEVIGCCFGAWCAMEYYRK